MSSYDPQAPQQPYLPPPMPPGSVAVPADSQPTTGADRWALIALAVSLTVLLSCVPGLNCLALLAPLGVGIVALTQARNAANPQRARTYGWIATGIGTLILVGLVAVAALYGVAILSAIGEAQRGLP